MYLFIFTVSLHAVPIALSVLALSGMTFVWRSVSLQLKAKNRTVWSLVSQFLAIRLVTWLGKRERKKLETDTLDICRVQEETLLNRLSKNAHTLYGRQYGLSTIKGNYLIWKCVCLMCVCCGLGAF